MAYCNNSSAASAAVVEGEGGGGGGSNQENSATNSSNEGVWKRKSKWVTKIRDPIKKRLIWLGTYASPEEASRVYQAKKIELEERVKAAAAAAAAAAAEKKKRKRNIPIIVSDDVLVPQQIQMNRGIVDGVEEKKRKLNGPTIVSDEEIEAASCELGGGAKESESESQSSSSSDERMEDDDILVRFGPVIINRQGFILGEFRWIDDLSII